MVLHCCDLCVLAAYVCALVMTLKVPLYFVFKKYVPQERRKEKERREETRNSPKREGMLTNLIVQPILSEKQNFGVHGTSFRVCEAHSCMISDFPPQ